MFHACVFVFQPGRIGNTWMGDPARLVMLEAVLNEVREKDLLGLTRSTGTILLDGLVDLTVCLYLLLRQNTRHFHI